jgi:radical SAM superfamily enzyme YgiQ (UPF0313 family)
VKKALVYNFSGEVDDIAALFPSERLARVGAILRRAGHDVTVLDRTNFTDLLRYGASFMENLGGLAFEETHDAYARGVAAEADELVSAGYDPCFMYLWSGTGFKFTMDLAAAIKQRAPATRLYGFGQRVDWFAGDILRLPENRLDGLVSGLGYNAVTALAAGADPAGVPDFIRLVDGVPTVNPRETIDVDDYPAPVYDDTVYRRLDAKIPLFQLTLSNQACPHACPFCVRVANYGRDIRPRAIGPVLAEMEQLFRDRGAHHFRIEDSTPPRGALTELAAAILKSPLNGQVRLSGFARADANRDEDFDLMRRAGFMALFFGIESLDDDTLVRLGKGFTYDTVRQTLRKVHAAGIRTVGSFIFPTPGETRSSMANTLRRIAELRPDLDALVVTPAGVYAPSDWGRHPERYGIRLAPNYVRECVVYPLKYLIPLRHWKPLPFSYRLMGKEAEEVTFQDIVSIQEEFVNVVRKDIKLPGLPDYYFLVADLMGQPAAAATATLVDAMMRRDYGGMRGFFTPGAPGLKP